MEEEDVLKLAQNSLCLEQESLKQKQTNYDVFRKQVSRSILQLFKMSESGSSKHSWKKGVNLAVQMQAMFNVSAKLQSPRQLRLLKRYDGGSPRLASVIDVRRPKYLPWGSRQIMCHLARCNDSVCVPPSRNSKVVIRCNQGQLCSLRDSQGSRAHHQ